MKRGHEFLFMILLCLWKGSSATVTTVAEAPKVLDSSGNPLKELTSYKIYTDAMFLDKHIGLMHHNCPPYVVQNNFTCTRTSCPPWLKYPSFQFQVSDANKHTIFEDTPVYIKADDETYNDFGKVCTTDSPWWQLVDGDLTSDKGLWYVKTGGNIGSDFGQKPIDFKFVKAMVYADGTTYYNIQHVDSGKNVGMYFNTGKLRLFLVIDTEEASGRRVNTVYVSFKKIEARPTAAFSSQASI